MEFLAGLLPFAILLVCPLMMIFMMRGMHGSHSGHEGHAAPEREPDGPTARKLAAMELEIARLRGEIDAGEVDEPDAVTPRRIGGRG
ncbi:MAG: DUF2933 domain-containing protein [Dehalococcoidia bacterium]|nr:MAG: DUF2933 domain-containing protein [Dehalococcoidia bacterium]